MAILTPEHLFAQADGLLTLYPKRKPRQTELRRAISASYYGVFHFVLARAADLHVGAIHKSTLHYALVYRSISHTWLRSLCLDVAKPTAPTAFKPFVPSGGFGQDMRRFAASTAYLQERRHTADYDPSVTFVRLDAKSAIAAARRAVDQFTAAPAEELQIFLALLLFPPRRA